MINNTDHQKLVNEILLAVGSMPQCRVWPRAVGFDRMKKIKYGIVGESDIDGIMMPNGRRISIEVKTGTGKLSKEQLAWRTMIEKFGGLYIEARSLEQVLTEVKAAL